MVDKKKKDKKDNFWKYVIIYPIVIGIMSLLLFLWNPILGALAFLTTIFLSFYAYDRERKNANLAKNLIENLEISFDEITKNAVFAMPFSMAVLNKEGKFLWYNNDFKKTFSIQDSLLGKLFSSLVPEFHIKDVLEKKIDHFQTKVAEESIEFHYNITKTNMDTLILLYGINNTENEEIRRKWLEEQLTCWNVYFDNYDELRAKMNELDRPVVFATVDRLLNAYAQAYDGFLIKYESDRYMILMEAMYFQKARKERFYVLDEVRAIDSPLEATLSIGIGYGDKTPDILHSEARQAIDIALSRGGDQVVMKDGENLDYFGGKNQATQKYSKVKARVIANAVNQFIDEANQVFIMGHQNADMDSFGSCLGMLHMVEYRRKKAYIVLDEISPAISNLYDKALGELVGLEKKILSPQEAEARLEEKDLIMVLDNHRKASCAGPSLLDHNHRILIIDHHRRGRGYIEDAAISYIEPYASSTSELVTELISYSRDEINIPQVVAEGLLAGITVDTKNFFYQTGARTFEAAALLKRQGADSIVIKQLFKDDYELVKYKSEIISHAKLYGDHILIGRFDHDFEGATLIASQAADDLLCVRKIDASFVLAMIKDKVHISARSLGGVSVQLIMERIGGGGHLTAAATQLDLDIDQAEDLLKKAIDEYFEEEGLNEGNITK